MLAVVLLALPVFAPDGDDPAEVGENPPVTDEVGETPPVTTNISPAVEVTTPPPDAAAADWTYRYLVPTGIALAILVVIATTGRYFTNVVRKRYRAVEE